MQLLKDLWSTAVGFVNTFIVEPITSLINKIKEYLNTK